MMLPTSASAADQRSAEVKLDWRQRIVAVLEFAKHLSKKSRMMASWPLHKMACNRTPRIYFFMGNKLKQLVTTHDLDRHDDNQNQQRLDKQHTRLKPTTTTEATPTTTHHSSCPKESKVDLQEDNMSVRTVHITYSVGLCWEYFSRQMTDLFSKHV